LNVFIAKMKNLIQEEDGQDLVEYALVVALIAFGAVAGMHTLATGLSTAFTTISTAIGSNIT
jgi:pilus assembly protein Flp/PilA